MRSGNFPRKFLAGTFFAKVDVTLSADRPPAFLLRMEFDMLVLSRKIEEKLMLNGNIEVRILEIKKGRVRIGIEAPREIAIERMELLPAELAAEVSTFEPCLSAT